MLLVLHNVFSDPLRLSFPCKFKISSRFRLEILSGSVPERHCSDTDSSFSCFSSPNEGGIAPEMDPPAMLSPSKLPDRNDTSLGIVPANPFHQRLIRWMCPSSLQKSPLTSNAPPKSVTSPTDSSPNIALFQSHSSMLERKPRRAYQDGPSVAQNNKADTYRWRSFHTCSPSDASSPLADRIRDILI